jgi:O-antigen/teichoic acid export membrane protein/glycosyltransferase involved in cell wall biosynthesis
MKKGRALIVFPDEWLQYSPSVLNLYNCFREKYDTKIVYVDNGRFKNDGLADNYKKINIGKSAAYFWRKTLGYKFYKVLRLLFSLLFIRLFDKRYDIVVAIDSSGYVATKVFFNRAIYFSLETETDNYFKISSLLGIETLIIQSKERKEYLLGTDTSTEVFYIQNSPILNREFKPGTSAKKKRILYMGNIEFGYGLEQFIECVRELGPEYSLTMKGIKNDKYFNLLQQNYKGLIDSGKLIFDFNYVDQDKIIEYTSQFYIGVTGYDLNLAKKSFNYFSSPAGKLFNYYAAGVPVIGIDIIGLKSVTDFKAGVLVDEVNPEKIKSAIKTIESNYPQFSENCIAASKKFDFKRAFNSFIEKVEGGEKANFNLKSFITKGHERSVKTKKNIFSSILIKCVSIVISFLLIPLALNYLNPVKFGIWLTITSVIGWFAFFDIGIGNGLRNKLAEALAKNDKELARTYISTSYAVLSIIIGIVYLLFILVFPYINWSVILNTPPEMSEEITRLIFIVFSFFSLQFIIKLISMILKADQRSAISGGINTLASLLSLIIVFILTKTTKGSLLWLSVGISAANIIAPLIASIWFFSKDYKHLVPSFKYIKLKSAKDLMGIGFLFFIMQFAALIVFSTDSFIIDQLYGPKEVTPYNIAFKYFSIITMGFAIITTPFWTAYTDAYHKHDITWIKRITKKLVVLWVALVFVVIGMIIFAGYFYKIWVGEKVQIPFLLSVSMGVWVLISTWTSIFGNFLSGVGKIRLSLYHSFAMIIINIPLSVFLAKYLNLGSTGVIIGTCLCILPQVFLHPIQFRKIVNNRASGVWGK